MISAFLAMAMLQQKQIRLDQGIVRVPQLVAQLGERSGEPLFCAANLRNEVVYVNLKPRSVGETMNLVAEVTGCEWLRRDQRIELTRTSAKLRQDQDLEKRWDVEQIQRAIAEIPEYGETFSSESLGKKLAEYQAIKKAGSDWNKTYAALLSLNPAKRLLSRILQGGDPSWITAVGPGRLQVFSNYSSRTLKALPFSIEPLIRQFHEERRLVAMSVLEADKDLLSDLLGHLDRGVEAEAQGPFKFYIQVRRFSGDYISVGLAVCGPSGMDVCTASQDIMLRSKEGPAHPLKSHLPPGLTIKRDPVSRALTKYRLSRDEHGPIINIIRDPVSNEPIEVIAEKPLDGFFEAVKKEAILLLPDYFAMTFLHAGEAEVSGSDVLYLMSFFLTTELRGDCLVGRPKRPFLARMSRADRWAMREFINSVPFGHPPSLDDLATYAAKQSPMASLDGLEQRWLGFSISGRSHEDLLQDLEVSYGRRDALRIWAALAPGHRQVIRRGGQVDASSFTSAVKDLLYSMLFEREIFVEYTPRPGIRLSMLNHVFPNGIPGDAFLESFPLVERNVKVDSKEGYGEFMSASSAGYITYMQEKGHWLNLEGGYIPLLGSLLQPADLKHMNVKIKLAPNVMANIRWKEYSFDPSIKGVTGDKLQGPAGEEFRRTLESYRSRGD